MKAADVMVTNVITVGPDAGVRDVAGLLLKNRISAVPVVGSKGELIGIVSEGDLLRRVESGTERHRSWWLEYMMSNEMLAHEFVQSHASKVSDVMKRDVITASPDTSLGDIASLLEKNGIKRVPIVKDGKIVGIVSRANLLQALAAVKDTITIPAHKDDNALRNQIMDELNSQSWSRPGLVNVIVRDGVVELWGIVESDLQRQAVRVAAESTDGVKTVTDNLIVRPFTGEG